MGATMVWTYIPFTGITLKCPLSSGASSMSVHDTQKKRAFYRRVSAQYPKAFNKSRTAGITT